MKTQASQFGELWEAVRDTQFGSTAAEANDLFHITRVEFQPPSKAHVKRLKRQRCLVLNRPPEKPKAPDAGRAGYNAANKTALKILQHYTNEGRIISELEANPVARHPFIAKAEAKPKPKVISAKQPDPLLRRHLIAVGKLRNFTGWTAKRSMEVLEIFGSFDKFYAECNR